MTKQILRESRERSWQVLTALMLVSFWGAGSALQASTDIALAKTNIDYSQDANTTGSALSAGDDVSIKEKQIVEINKNLKNAIEENQRLTEANKKITDEMGQLKNEHQEGSSRYEELKKERDGLAETIEQVRSTNRKYSQQLKAMGEEVKNLEGAKAQVQEEKEMLAKNLAEASAKKSQESDDVSGGNDSPSPSNEEVIKREANAVDLLSRIDAFTEQDERLKTDSAKAHYNMGNIYFQKGEYEIAAREYYQAVMLMPDDADAHYNLAYVSSEYLQDYKTALKHYKTYLYLQPNAKDIYLVKEKILEAQLHLRNTINSPLDEDNK